MKKVKMFITISVLLVIVIPICYSQDFEETDWSDYIEVDESGLIYAHTSQYIHMQIRADNYSYLYKDFGIGYFGGNYFFGDFSYRVICHLEDAYAGSVFDSGALFIFSNYLGNIDEQINADADFIIARVHHPYAFVIRVDLTVYENGEIVDLDSRIIHAQDHYYGLELIREEKTYTLKFWSANYTSTLYSSISVESSNNLTFNYFYPLASNFTDINSHVYVEVYISEPQIYNSVVEPNYSYLVNWVMFFVVTITIMSFAVYIKYGGK